MQASVVPTVATYNLLHQTYHDCCSPDVALELAAGPLRYGCPLPSAHSIPMCDFAFLLTLCCERSWRPTAQRVLALPSSPAQPPPPTAIVTKRWPSLGLGVAMLRIWYPHVCTGLHRARCKVFLQTNS
ncbi:hypothetical protein U9M48_006799 [Paspalum notatum var. saurae]|uniref:Uncharacterized protein n=1 Tax=Paspalum notatum var. saurae TaxID=547442 RepID=A0AAQ3PYQ1_PASNO